MIAIASGLVVAGVAVPFVLGLIHLLYTFRGRMLHPRDPDLYARLNEVSLVITRQTTMWRAWVGFNASHSYGLIFFGLLYGYLALVHSAILFHSAFLQGVGLMLLGGYAVLARLYWFRFPLRAILLSATLYSAALILAWL
jgi:hypothetical protein